jgi:hypothetical protein
MSVERQRKIELLLRKNEAKREHQDYRSELSQVLKYPIDAHDLLDLKATDDLYSQFDANARRKDAMRSLKCTWPTIPNSAWIRVCLCLAQELKSEPVALFAGPYKECGAIRIAAEHPLTYAPSVLEFDGDTLRMHSLASDGGLYLDLYEEKGSTLIELSIWGAWCLSAPKCLEGAGGGTLQR